MGAKITRRAVGLGALGVGLTNCASLRYVVGGTDVDVFPSAVAEEGFEMASPYTNPLILTAGAIVAPRSDQALDPVALANPNGLPWVLHEIRWRLLPQTGTYRSEGGFMSGLGVGVKMDLGQAAVSDAYFPVGDFASMRDTYEGAGPLFSLPVNAPGNATTLSFPSYYSWRLKYPLFIPQGRVLNCIARALGQANFGARVDVIYIGRTWDVTKPLPKKVMVPWAASYESKNFDFLNNQPVGTDQSTSVDISNSFQTPLEIDKISCRVGIVYNTTFAPADSGFTDTNPIYEDPVDFRNRLMRLRLRSSRGFDILREWAYLGGVFPANWRTWQVPGRWAMAPGEFYTAYLNVVPSDSNNPPAGTIAVSGGPARGQASVGLVGYREVPVEAL